MSDRAASMTTAKRRINTEKRERITAVIAQIEAHQEIRSLKARLARTLGQEIADKHPEHSVSAAAVKYLHAQVALADPTRLIRSLRRPVLRENGWISFAVN